MHHVCIRSKTKVKRNTVFQFYTPVVNKADINLFSFRTGKYKALVFYAQPASRRAVLQKSGFVFPGMILKMVDIVIILYDTYHFIV